MAVGISHTEEPAGPAGKAKGSLPPIGTSQLKALEDGLECAICQEIFSEPVTLYCGHTFCCSCVWQLKHRGHTSCPTCREHFNGLIPNRNVFMYNMVHQFFPEKIEARTHAKLQSASMPENSHEARSPLGHHVFRHRSRSVGAVSASLPEVARPEARPVQRRSSWWSWLTEDVNAAPQSPAHVPSPPPPLHAELPGPLPALPHVGTPLGSPDNIADLSDLYAASSSPRRPYNRLSEVRSEAREAAAAASAAEATAPHTRRAYARLSDINELASDSAARQSQNVRGGSSEGRRPYTRLSEILETTGRMNAQAAGLSSTPLLISSHTSPAPRDLSSPLTSSMPALALADSTPRPRAAR